MLSDEKSFIKRCYQYIIITACVVALIIAFVLPNCIYKRWPLNVLESLFILNLGAVSGLLAIFCCINSIIPHSKFSYKPYYFVYPSVTLTMVLFAGILIYVPLHEAAEILLLVSKGINGRLKLLRLRKFHDEEETKAR